MKVLIIGLFLSSCANLAPVYKVNTFKEGSKLMHEALCRNLNKNRCLLRSREFCQGLNKQFLPGEFRSMQEQKSLADKKLHYFSFQCK